MMVHSQAMLQTSECGKRVIGISDYTNVFVMLVNKIWKMQLQCSVQTECWNGVVVDINATCTEMKGSSQLCIVSH